MKHAAPSRRSQPDAPRLRITRSAPVRAGSAGAPGLWIGACLLAACAGSAMAQAPVVLSNGATPGDRSIAADQRGFVAQQGAIQALNDTGKHPVASYSLAKAQCWLDVSFHEYTHNDRSAFPQQALEQAALITSYLAGGGAVDDPANPALQTPLVNNAPRLRDDLWKAVQHIKTREGARCAERLTACGEVELVHAGNEFAQLGWRHANPYVQLAEDYVASARKAEEDCPPTRAKPVPTPPPVEVITPPVQPEPMRCPEVPVCAPVKEVPPPQKPPVPQTRTLRFEALAQFTFDGRTTSQLLAADILMLRNVATDLKLKFSRIDRIEIQGHTDRLGAPAYNLKLSQDRAEAIKQTLEGSGTGAEIVAIGRGATEPKPQTLSCKGNKATPQLIACLQPSRRVEFVVTGVPREVAVDATVPVKP
jgi:outer membrane protein OmpA-like peptidoglycan-associated protein